MMPAPGHISGNFPIKVTFPPMTAEVQRPTHLENRAA